MNLALAAYQVVHDYKGGAAVVGALTGINPHTLAHKVAIREAGSGSTAILGLEDAARISECTGDMRILHAFAARLRHLAVPLPAANEAPGDVSARIVAITRELGEYFAAVGAAVADGRVTPNELRTIQREQGDLVRAVAELDALLERMAAPPPAPLDTRTFAADGGSVIGTLLRAAAGGGGR